MKAEQKHKLLGRAFGRVVDTQEAIDKLLAMGYTQKSKTKNGGTIMIKRKDDEQV